MAKLSVSADLIAQRLFGWSENAVAINSAAFDPAMRQFEMDVSGEDVPQTERVTAIITVQQNRAGEKFHTITFEPVEEK